MMDRHCKAADIIWRVEATWNVAFQTLERVDELQRQVADLSALVASLRAGTIPEVEARPIAATRGFGK
ncbi:hypothetical protein [Roseomonas genomospecies 6]|uniref:Uncharacterized protein n=1 Tax=Roseomonas genomospecies 6 TaxID=214106 RepID=A0A9W7NHX3_9PROT|nr:hypothetical protein [Roseomonas genomospecies 6]KAA0679166.1 hypothetical protein DS843_16755 [Roseomonas genomospecies 6]